jgi:hypothetical protein
VSLRLLFLSSRVPFTLAMRACSLEPLLSVMLHVSQRDLKVVKPELGMHCFLLGFPFSPPCVSPDVG